MVADSADFIKKYSKQSANIHLWKLFNFLDNFGENASLKVGVKKFSKKYQLHI
jgi:hypothetical protein